MNPGQYALESRRTKSITCTHQHASGKSKDTRLHKKTKSRGRLCGPSNLEPGFWDGLPKIWLTPRTLRELDLWNSTQRSEPVPGSRPLHCMLGISLHVSLRDMLAYDEHFNQHIIDYNLYPRRHHLRDERPPRSPIISTSWAGNSFQGVSPRLHHHDLPSRSRRNSVTRAGFSMSSAVNA